MRRILVLLGLLLPAMAGAAITYTQGPHKLYKGGVFQSNWTSHAQCIAEGERTTTPALNKSLKFRCVVDVTARGVANPPTPVNCVVSAWSAWAGGAWQPTTCPANGVQTRQETRTRTIVTPPSNGGTACPALSETQTASQNCTPPPALGQATLSWTPPTTRADGSVLTNLAGYRVRYGNSAGSYPNVVTLSNPGLTMHVVTSLQPGQYYFVITAFDSAGLESVYAGPVNKVL